MDFEIIDFHTHPAYKPETSISVHKSAGDITTKQTIELLNELGVSKICGSVVKFVTGKPDDIWAFLKQLNDEALELASDFKGIYYPGFHVHPKFLDESIKEIDRFYSKGYKLIGELTPYIHWYDTHEHSYNEGAMQDILDYASQKGMILSAHPSAYDDMDELCKNHPNLIIVGAHPSENVAFDRHVERAKKYKNYYIDVSGGGIARYGCARRLVNEIGAEKVLFGSDYPICNLQMFVDGIKNDLLLSNEEKRLILAENTKRILKI